MIHEGALEALEKQLMEELAVEVRAHQGIRTEPSPASVVRSLNPDPNPIEIQVVERRLRQLMREKVKERFGEHRTFEESMKEMRLQFYYMSGDEVPKGYKDFITKMKKTFDAKLDELLPAVKNSGALQPGFVRSKGPIDQSGSGGVNYTH